jgi:hypothetical protein
MLSLIAMTLIYTLLEERIKLSCSGKLCKKLIIIILLMFSLLLPFLIKLALQERPLTEDEVSKIAFNSEVKGKLRKDPTY